MRPEERIRQALLEKMVDQLGYPRSLIAVEKELIHLCQGNHINIPKRRIDLLCYERQSMKPLLLIECKAVPLTRNVFEQVLGYNYYIQAPFVAVVNEENTIMGSWNPSLNKYSFSSELLSYYDLEKLK